MADESVYHRSQRTDHGTPDHILDAVREIAPISLDPATGLDNRTGALAYCALDGVVVAGRDAFGVEMCGDPMIRQGWNTLPESAVVNGGVCVGDDGLECDWTRYGLTFVNCPYGRGITSKWTAKCAVQGQHGAEIVALLPCRPATAWWCTNVLKSQAIAFHDGRVRFAGAKSGAPFPSALAYWGKRPWAFEQAMVKHCWVVRNWSK